jgi:hypothetical protein
VPAGSDLLGLDFSPHTLEPAGDELSDPFLSGAAGDQSRVHRLDLDQPADEVN